MSILSAVPFDISTHYDDRLRGVPNDPVGMENAVGWLEERLEETDDHTERARILGMIGSLQRLLGHLDAAEETLTRAFDLCRDLDDERMVTSARLRLAHTYQWQGRFELSNRIFEEEVVRCETIPALHERLHFAYQHAGKNLFDQERYDEAGEYFRRALELREGMGDEELIESTRFALNLSPAFGHPSPFTERGIGGELERSRGE